MNQLASLNPQQPVIVDDQGEGLAIQSYLDPRGVVWVVCLKSGPVLAVPISQLKACGAYQSCQADRPRELVS
jgi:hypothetical protein